MLYFAIRMADKKNWGSTVMGWFIVQDAPDGGSAPQDDYAPEAASSDDDALIQRAAGGQDEPLQVFTSAPPPPAPGGAVAFESVYEAAGITPEEHQRVSRTLELLDSLPPDTDETVKRQIVMASLRAFGVPIEKIIESGAEQLQALEAYIRGGAKDTEHVTAEAEQRIRQFEEEIARLRKEMQQRVDEQQQVMRACNAKKLEVQRVLEFFGQDAVAKVVRESPKLHEPKG
jgi:DNA-binding transcriptional MerR regulator